jgi:transposase-like protein
MDFPIAEFMDEDSCYEKLVDLLHPEGLACPRCHARDDLRVHRRHRAPVLDYRCDACGRVFNAFTGTAFHKTHRRPSEILLILRGIAQGETTAQLARELDRHRQHLLKLRHRLQEAALKAADPLPLDDTAVEADEMYQNAGEKRCAAYRP